MPGLKSLLGPLNNPKPLSGNIQSLLPSLREAMGVEPPDAPEADKGNRSLAHYGSEEELKEALAAVGPRAYVIGVRRLDIPLLPFRDAPDGSRADRNNIELNHPHLFYLDADSNLHDAGYFGSEDEETGGKRGIRFDHEMKAGRIGDYHFGPVSLGGEITRETLNLKGFGPDDYFPLFHNCQHYMEALQNSVLIPGWAPGK